MEALACSTVAVTITKDANVNNIFRRLVILNSRSRGAVIDTHDSELGYDLLPDLIEFLGARSVERYTQSLVLGFDDTMTSQGEQFFRIK